MGDLWAECQDSDRITRPWAKCRSWSHTMPFDPVVECSYYYILGTPCVYPVWATTATPTYGLRNNNIRSDHILQERIQGALMPYLWEPLDVCRGNFDTFLITKVPNEKWAPGRISSTLCYVHNAETIAKVPRNLTLNCMNGISGAQPMTTIPMSHHCLTGIAHP